MGLNEDDMSNHHNSSLTKDFLASPPVLSLSLAGIFRYGESSSSAAAAAATAGMEENADQVVLVEEGGGGRRDELTLDINSDNSGAARLRLEEEIDGEGLLGDFEDEDDDEVQYEDDEDDHDIGDRRKKRKRRKYHRHTPEQIKEMESLFKESPHPDEKQRKLLSIQLGLSARQVKFWFQNRRTQIKAMQERHENSLLKTEMDKIKDDNKILRETLKRACCQNCGFTNAAPEDQHLHDENIQLKAEVEKLRAVVGKYRPGSLLTSSSCLNGNEHEDRSLLNVNNGIFGLEKPRIMGIANQAMEELKKMATDGEPLWVLSVETGREILNYDEYTKDFSLDNGMNLRPKRSIEASRDSVVVFIDLHRLLQCFMDVNQWKDMFSSIVSKANTVYVISNGEGPHRNGAIQLMFAELQMLTPLVPTREINFVRYCKQMSVDLWAIVDVSIDQFEDNFNSSHMKCQKKASGCIIEDKGNGHCKVTWVEHLEYCKKTIVPTMYRSIVNSGMAFGAKRWVSTLQQQCERIVFSLASNVPTKDSTGVPSLAGRKSILKFVQRMTSSFCRAIGSSSYHTWTKVLSKNGEDIRLCSRKNLTDPGEPLGLIVCAVSSLWLPVSQHDLFDFLRDETHRHEWDVMSKGVPSKLIANLAKGQNQGNAVTIQTMKAKDNNNIWILQDSCTNNYESMVVYAAVDVSGMQSAMAGCDSSHTTILASGFAILSDGMESRPMVIRTRQEEEAMGAEGGSVLTMAIQVLINSNPTAKFNMESMESVNSIISSCFKKIKIALHCEEC
ncbi:homeobox-leucine zipper protein GLABRA 2-like [Impatiens glandulifera]|uniref:homeobox-leucine zipper protein GLABRA 2-like n=1 Tax=Impatiens glandulifera TaxID=253017 RepID=UPI001FB16D23|nr:homeobox-leucine zipper protein GLABRA 2-like [Impatiens glandulifera]